ncbi:Wings apart-like protein 2 [Hibiscus trionum]|uniref:Wings apart-like protein 2 n=1 Tax=Hibiscus trionum TaxID=183268 RepID=A0A9W7MV31_HIBTR|nr:Wings apart-like protein 2 [Hibiscus trionum]
MNLLCQGQDDHLLEPPCCIRFLIKILKPITPTAKENKTEKVGFKLLALLKDADISRYTTQVLDSTSAAIISKVEEILVSCKCNSMGFWTGTIGYSGLLLDCLLAAIKVLMNLTNDNLLGCQQIAASGALETLSTLIACHYPTFCSYLPRSSEMEVNSLTVELHNQKDRPLTDPELDFLVAILGLHVNLVETDEHNRSRLAAASVCLPNSKGLREGSPMDVIPLLCAIFLANQGEDDDGEILSWNDEAAMLQEEKEAEKMILEAYAALLLAFLSTESKSTRNAIANCLPKRSLSVLVPVLERFVVCVIQVPNLLTAKC